MIDFNINTTSTVNKVNAKVELYEGSTLVETCTCNDRLQDFTVERIGLNNKFFGFGIVHKLSVVLIDLERSLTITKDSSFKVYFGYGAFISPYPTFYVAEATRDETTNAISIVAYDKLYAANEATINDLALEAPYTVRDVTQACGAKLGIAETRCGKNLWNNNSDALITEAYGANITKTTTGFIFERYESGGAKRVSLPIAVKAGETYTFSAVAEQGANFYIRQGSESGTILSSASSDANFLTYTFTENMTAYFSIVILENITTIEVSNIQIEKSAIRTPYEPYLAAFDTSYSSGANFEGTEACREVLNAIAEVTQTIYFLNKDEALMFKRLDRGGAPVHTITKDDYYELDSGETRVLAAITNTNELGDSTSVEVDGITGVVQYVRNNPFWELREDIQLLLAHAGSAIGGIAATPFYCDWDGNFLLEVGDKIALTAEDNSTITSYLLYDTIRYDGILAEATQFVHDGKDETASNPLSLGDALKQTYAKVDKQNKQIQLVVSESAENKSKITSLTQDVNGIKLAIESLEDATIGDFTELTTRVAALELSDTEIKASVEENKTTVEAVEKDLEAVETDLGTTAATLGALQGTVETHTTKIGTLTTTTNSISGRVSSVETRTTTLEASVDTLGENVQNNNSTITNHTERIGALEITNESITASVSTLNSKTSVLETDLQALDGAVTEQGESIDNLGSSVMTNTENIAALQIRENEISASVSSLEEKTETQIDGLETNYTSLEEKVSAKITKNDLTIAIEAERVRGADKVRTSTGFTFNDSGLTIDQSGSKTSTNINSDGMVIYDGAIRKNEKDEITNEKLLEANHKGVKAKDLHATTYLLIGANTYFADYQAEDGEDRAGCFWYGL